MPDAVLRDMLADPALPVGATDRRLAALHEAHDHIVSRRLAAGAAASLEAAAGLVARLAAIDPALAATLRWHATLAPVLAALPASRARNAVLGDVRRGDLLTWATSVRSWTWQDGWPPADSAPIGAADGELTLDESPALYDAVLAWDPASGVLVVVPPQRNGVSWEPAGAGWTVRLTRVTFHADEVIRVATDPRRHPAWRDPAPRPS
ncbi:hypothetical protein [Dactylosporangium sp. CA-092794]|uniref:hypothetical protein n=1 Tax=Dactylosporangium sp. CA-092794 TaxID=3239929 RepID=UPI003D8D7B3A